MRKIELVAAALTLAAFASPALAQGRGRGRGGDHDRDQDRDEARIPPGQMPSPGMCRIWIDGVPPGRQPRETDCATARANVPPNAQIIYGGGPEIYTSNGTVIPNRIPNGAGRLPSRIPGSTQYPYPNTSQYPYGYPSQVVNPVIWNNGQQCVQYPDASGRTRYDCNREDVNRQLACNANPSSQACSAVYNNTKRHKKHKDKDRDRDGDRDGDEGRGN